MVEAGLGITPQKVIVIWKAVPQLHPGILTRAFASSSNQSTVAADTPKKEDFMDIYGGPIQTTGMKSTTLELAVYTGTTKDIWLN